MPDSPTEPTQPGPETAEPIRPNLPADDKRVLVEARCQAVGFQIEWLYRKPNPDSDEHGGYSLKFAFPNGRYSRWNTVNDAKADLILESGIAAATALGDYEAFFYPDLSEIEAQIRPIAPFSPSPNLALQNLPGVITVSPAAASDEDADELDDQPKETWTLPFPADPDQDWLASIGMCSDHFPIYAYRTFGASHTITLKIGGVTKQRHDELLTLLERTSDAILFELDLRYSITLGLAKLPAMARRRRTGPAGQPILPPRGAWEISDEVPRLPRNAYPAKPLALYWYARSASNMPLLQFLASYQILEYYFTTYYQHETLDRMKQELLDPRFSPQNDTHLMRLLNLATPQGKIFGSEREQLRATVRACVPTARLKEYLNDPARRQFFSGKQVIRDVARLDVDNSSADLRDQVADRIYDIRCRVVHAKSDSGDRYPELLLPFSEEADSLTFDIELVQYLAQRVIIHRAEPLRI